MGVFEDKDGVVWERALAVRLTQRGKSAAEYWRMTGRLKGGKSEQSEGTGGHGMAAGSGTENVQPEAEPAEAADGTDMTNEVLPVDQRLLLIPPNKCQWGNCEAIDVPPQSWQLLSYLVDHRTAKTQDVADAVWGEQSSDLADKTINSALSRLNTRLAAANIPVSASMKAGFITLFLGD
jgi:hypothetical protein